MDRYPEIDEVIAYIHQHIYDPLPLTQLARYVGYSPYHFTRIFKEKTGLSPLYYVSSYRLQKAKDLLLHTNYSIRDISMEIGQQSLGTFTTRFTERVGVTPAQFRQSIQQAEESMHSLQNLRNWDPENIFPLEYSTIEGTIQADVPFTGVILIGLFPKPIPEGMPLYGTLLSSLGPFSFKGVKPGIYYLLATSVTWGTEAKDVLLPNRTLRFRSKEPIIVEPFMPVPHQKITLYEPRLDDPPILISLPLLMNHFLNRVFQHSNR